MFTNNHSKIQTRRSPSTKPIKNIFVIRSKTNLKLYCALCDSLVLASPPRPGQPGLHSLSSRPGGASVWCALCPRPIFAAFCPQTRQKQTKKKRITCFLSDKFFFFWKDLMSDVCLRQGYLCEIFSAPGFFVIRIFLW